MFKTVLAGMLLFSTSAFAQYQGSVQPDGTGGANVYGADGRFQATVQPNGTGGANIYGPVQAAPTYPVTPPSGFVPLPNGRR